MNTFEFYGYTCVATRHTYPNGRPAISVEDADTGEPICKASVNMPELDLEEDEVLIKDWSENEGILDALVSAGVIELTGNAYHLLFVDAPVARILI